MKKTFLFIICIIIIVLVLFYARYLYYKQTQAEIKEYNLEYEVCLDKQITGRDLTTIINKAVDNNEKNLVKKDEQGFYIGNETNSVQIDIQMIDIETIYKMETIYNGGMTNFIRIL